MDLYQVDDDDLTADEVIMEGVVAMQSANASARWQRRMAQLTPLNFSLFREKIVTPSLAIPVEQIIAVKEIQTPNPKEHMWSLEHGDKIYMFRVETRHTMLRWIACVEAAKSVFERGDDDDDEAEAALKKTAFSDVELATVEVTFHENCGPDLTLTLKQFKQVFGAIGVANAKLIQSIFLIMDKDGDNRLSKAEFLLGMSTLLKGTFEQRVDLAFRVMDQNGDGILTYEELCKVLKYQMCAGVRLICLVWAIADQEEKGKGKDTQVIVPDIPDDQLPVKDEDVAQAARDAIKMYDKENKNGLTITEFSRWARKDPKLLPIMNGEFQGFLKTEV